MLPELVADLASGHAVKATVFEECHSMYRSDGPVELRSLGETEFVTGVAAMSASGGYGPARACAAMVGNIDLMLGGDVARLLDLHIAASGGRFSAVRYSTAWHPSDAVPNVVPDAHRLPSLSRQGSPASSIAASPSMPGSFTTRSMRSAMSPRRFPG